MIQETNFRHEIVVEGTGAAAKVFVNLLSDLAGKTRSTGNRDEKDIAQRVALAQSLVAQSAHMSKELQELAAAKRDWFTNALRAIQAKKIELGIKLDTDMLPPAEPQGAKPAGGTSAQPAVA